jgi:hypothetical protein
VKTLTWCALIFGLASGGGCSLVSSYGQSEKSSSPSGSEVDPPPARTVETDPDDPSAAKTEAAPLTDAGATDTACAAQSVTWTVGSSSCTANAARVEEFATQKLRDETPEDTGSVTVTCFEGRLTVSNAVCEPPKVIDVGTAGGCGTGYCMAAVAGNCGVPDPAKADAVCVAKGYAAATTYQTMPGPVRALQCHADGSGCFANANPSCNIVFTTVTCRH